MSSEKRTRSVEFMCLLLYYGGILHPYSKSNNPCKVEVYKRGLHAKFDCWFITKSEKEHTVSFVVQAYFVKRVRNMLFYSKQICYAIFIRFMPPLTVREKKH